MVIEVIALRSIDRVGCWLGKGESGESGSCGEIGHFRKILGCADERIVANLFYTFRRARDSKGG